MVTLGPPIVRDPQLLQPPLGAVHPMAFPTALCASWRYASRRGAFGASFGRQRGVLLGAQLALSQRQREWAEKAMEGRAGAFNP